MNTNEKKIANCCMNHSEHPVFKETDGARCVVCNGLISQKFVTAAEYSALPTYQELRKQYKPKPQKHYHNAAITNISSYLNYDRSGAHSLSIDILFMHDGQGFDTVGEAYNELVEDIHQLLLKSKRVCEQSTLSDEDLPTRLEGSD